MNNAIAIQSRLQSDDAVEQIIGFSDNLLIKDLFEIMNGQTRKLCNGD